MMNHPDWNARKTLHQSEEMFDNLQLASLIGLAGVLEVAGSLVAYFMAHASQGHVLAPLLNQGELAVLYSFLFLYFVFARPARRRETRQALA